MLLKQIILKNFRNFGENSFQFNPFLTIIIGENARGKTNLLEAIYFIIHGFGFRESREEELIALNKEKTEVEGKFGLGDQSIDFKILLRKKDEEIEKIFMINKTNKRYFQYRQEATKAVLFSPEQIEIITGSPQERRSYLDKLLSYDLDYKKKIRNYEAALRKRNKILEAHRDEDTLREELKFWNQYLEEQGFYINKKRQEHIDFLKRHAAIDDKKFSIDYLKNEFRQDRLEEIFEKETRYKKTLIGPQKDDFQIYQEAKESQKNIHHFGSRSEQRLAVFWLKLNEVRLYEELFTMKPILLLDDIFSELDRKNKKIVVDLIQKYQTVITTTEIELLDLIDMPKSIITV